VSRNAWAVTLNDHRTVAHSPAGAWWREPLVDILAGTVGGILGRLIEYPFDTVKVKLQAASIGACRVRCQRAAGPPRFGRAAN
jgi:hypothetical protein